MRFGEDIRTTDSEQDEIITAYPAEDATIEVKPELERKNEKLEKRVSKLEKQFGGGNNG